jgi:hypothetical protein
MFLERFELRRYVSEVEYYYIALLVIEDIVDKCYNKFITIYDTMSPAWG